MPLNLTGNQIQLIEKANIAFTITHHLAVTLHGVQATDKTFLFSIGNFKARCDGGGICGNADLGQQFKNQFAAGDRIFVFVALTLKMRVARP